MNSALHLALHGSGQLRGTPRGVARAEAIVIEAADNPSQNVKGVVDDDGFVELLVVYDVRV